MDALQEILAYRSFTLGDTEFTVTRALVLVVLIATGTWVSAWFRRRTVRLVSKRADRWASPSRSDRSCAT